MYKRLLFSSLFLTASLPVFAQNDVTAPEIHGTIRGKYEYQTSEGDGRFEESGKKIRKEN